MDDVVSNMASTDLPGLDYESPQTRLNQRRPPPPHSVGRLFAVAALVFCGVLSFFASHREGDIAEGIGATIIVIGLLLFLIEFVLVWWRRPR